MGEPCICWTTSPVVIHQGHCCMREAPDDHPIGTPPPCGHWVGEVRDG